MIFPLVYIPAIFVQVREHFVDHGCGVEWRMRKTIIVSISFFRTKYGTQLCSERKPKQDTPLFLSTGLQQYTAPHPD